MRVKVCFSYDGSKFLGSAPQPHKNTVLDKFNSILKKLQITTVIRASGRTDKGVHALNQVIDFDIPSFWNDLHKLKYILNLNLNPSIYIKSIIIVDNNFHARFSAKKRVYRYIISTTELTPFNSAYLSYIKNIDIKRLQKSIKLFEGVHDFNFFKKLGSDNINDTREIFKTNIYQYHNLIIFYFEANSFLRGQIRMMMGFLLQINSNKLNNSDLKEQLNLTNRFNYKLAPANGLYLSKIKY